MLSSFAVSSTNTRATDWQDSDEQHRLDTLRALAILDTRREEHFDRITRTAARYFNVPIAVITLVDEDRQWFKSCVGLTATETPREISFCTHAIRKDATMVVPDAAIEPRFSRNPLVTGDPFIRFYAGAPLTVSNGSRLGTLCVIDSEPRPNFSGDDVETLEDLAMMVVHLIENRTEAEELAQTLESKVTAARAVKNQFLSMMGHELRTPLNAVIGFSELIHEKAQADCSHEKCVAYSHHIHDSGRHLLRRINAILEWPGVETGALNLSTDNVDIAAMIDDIVSYLTTRSAFDIRRLTVDIEDNLPPVTGDAERMFQAVLEIIDNALQFTPPDSKVFIRAVRSGEAIILTIEDEGPGMTPGQLDQAMTPFAQVNMELSRPVDGIGLGLPLSKRMIELQHGRFDIVSAPSSGTRVTITFPASDPDKPL